jgi:hypothetical protein
VAQEIKLTGPSMAQRIADRLKNSGQGSGTNPDLTTKQGESANRVFHNLHFGTGGPGVTGGAGKGDRK